MRFLALALLSLLPSCASAEALPKDLLGSHDAGLTGTNNSFNGSGGDGTYQNTGGDPGSAGGDPGSSGGFGGDPSGSGGSPEFGSGGSTDTGSSGGAATGGSTGFVFPPLPPPAPVSDAGACANAICFDVFDCAIFHPGNNCGFTKCDGFICKP
jgi:hypothetical protein